MNPHFMFNAINGIQNQILTAKKMEAYGYLGKFADLLRTITINSDSTTIALKQEIHFLKTYLELEKLRFRTGFNFAFEGVEELPDLKRRIPAMMIQPFVENAIMHGLSTLSYPGKLEVIFEPLSWGVRCIVRDNGRGRAAGRERTANEPSNHLSITYRNTEARILSLRESGYSLTAIEVHDLVEEGVAKGTQVELYLPFLPTNTAAFTDDHE
jgi:LytS/YehU family sensor histidine kinase